MVWYISCSLLQFMLTQVITLMNRAGNLSCQSRRSRKRSVLNPQPRYWGAISIFGHEYMKVLSCAKTPECTFLKLEKILVASTLHVTEDKIIIELCLMEK